MKVMKKILMSLFLMAGMSFGIMAAETAAFPGGKDALDKFIAKTMVYPESSKSMGVEGVVNVQFTVNPDGTLSDIKIVRMVDPDLEKEAIRIVKKMPAWQPAEKDGTAVASTAKVAIHFVLE